MPAHLNILLTSIEYLKGVGPSRAELLKNELGLFTFKDLLHYFPYKYIDKTRIYKIAQIKNDMPSIQIKGQFLKLVEQGVGRRKRLVGQFKDDTGRIDVIWFKGVSWIKKSIRPGEEYILFGKPTIYKQQFNIAHPEIEKASDGLESFSQHLFPMYNTTEKMKVKYVDSRAISKLVMNLLVELKEFDFQDNLTSDIEEKYRLPTRKQSFYNIHFPKNETLQKQASFRLKFEELFFIQLNLLSAKSYRKQKYKGHAFKEVSHYFNSYFNNQLHFELTDAQKRVIKEIRRDMKAGSQMNRLLQGDVGSGKTIVALMSILIALDNGYQTCLMAPTEILASQHFKSISMDLFELGIKVELLTGSVSASKKDEIIERSISGDIDLLIGTHALIEDNVKFKNLGFVVIDEQHRFGVVQRSKLMKKNTIPPHMLVMTATPIPRTLALTVYGDLDTSVIDEMPPGRKLIKTYHRTGASRLRVFGFIREQISLGFQVYIVYPLIEESTKLDYADLMDGYESVCRAFEKDGYKISVAHGRMKSQDKEFEMQRFAKGESQIMVATNVIEVGVNVPNANIMIVESAERFGLAQLHQLRGRVGRGEAQSYCVLMTKDELSRDSYIRMKTMTETNDGFKIAEVDLKLRGPGDITGTQQSGMMPMKIANLATDGRILQEARNSVVNLLEEDPAISLDKHKNVSQYLKKIMTEHYDWARIS
jgi:ATP-dependent DNA helicase RecG